MPALIYAADSSLFCADCHGLARHGAATCPLPDVPSPLPLDRLVWDLAFERLPSILTLAALRTSNRPLRHIHCDACGESLIVAAQVEA